MTIRTAIMQNQRRTSVLVFVAKTKPSSGSFAEGSRGVGVDNPYRLPLE